MHVTLVHNPASGDGGVSRAVLEGILEAAGYDVRYQPTKGKWRSALRRPADFVVVAGGDGAVRKVAGELAGRNVPLAVLPLGVANNFAKTLGIHGELREIVEGWKEQSPVPVDLGIVKASGGTRWFTESVGGGLMAELIAQGDREVEAPTEIAGHAMERALVLLRRLAEDAVASDWSVEVDGKDHSGRYLGVEIMNVRFGGPNLPLAPKARVDDGRLDTVFLGPDDRAGLLHYLNESLLGATPNFPQLQSVRGSEVRLVPPGGVRVHADDATWQPRRAKAGSARAGLRPPIEIAVRPSAISVLAPGGSRPGI